MNTPRASVGAVACLAAVGFLAGCAQPVGSDQAAKTTAVRSAPVTSARPVCDLVDFTRIRSLIARDPQRLRARQAVPASARRWFSSSDPRSFAGVVSAAQLTAAGVNTSSVSQDRLILVIVNRGGHIPAVGGGTGSSPVSPIAAPTPTKPPVTWVIYELDAQTYLPIQYIVAPENPCVRF